MFSFAKKDAVCAPRVLDPESAAAQAYAHDKDLSLHHFVEGEHPIVRIEHLKKL